MRAAEPLEGIPLFSSLTPEQRRDLAADCVVKDCPRGTLLFSEGDEAGGLYFMLSGRVKIYRAAPDGREAVLHVFGPGEPFGEVAVFQGGAFPASAVCLEAGAALLLPRSALLDHISRDPALALNMLAALSRRLRAFAAKVETLTLMETPQRLAAYLLLNSEDQGNSVRLDVSKSLLAGILGTARETLSRALTRMAEQGIVTVEGRTVHIENRALLEGLARGLEEL